jgi:hypothetical protein
MTLDLHSPSGSHNKVLVGGMSSGSGNSKQVQNQVKLLTDQVKGLTGSSLGTRPIDSDDPAMSSLKEDVARLAMDNQTIKASLGGEIVRIDNEASHSAKEVRKWVVACVGLESGTYEFFFDVTSVLKSL